METKICNKCGDEKDICEFNVYNKIKELRINTCRLCKKKYLKDYNQHTLDVRRERKKEYRTKNSELIKEKKKNYYLVNKDKIREYKRKWETDKRKTDLLFKIKQLVRNRLYKFIISTNGKLNKNNKTFDIVGCSPEFLKEYLEKQFTEGMSWELMGHHIHIDHITPLSSASTEEELYKLCHYTNLQPLWAQENLSKGNKII